MDCETSRTWIWESLRGTEEAPEPVARHLEACEGCRAEQGARLALARDLRGLRLASEVETPPALDRRVLEAAHAAVSAHQTGRFRFDADLDGLGDDLDADTLSALDVAIARDLAGTGRVAVRPEWQLPPQEAPDPAASWQPPRATASWMVAAAAVMAAALLLGFVGGRLSAPGPAVHATLATSTAGLVLSGLPRMHSVGLSRDTVDTLNKGNTYLLAGPVGGPYEVVGVVRWDEADMLPVPSDDGGEIIVAVGPPGGWSRGKQLALNDMHASDLEILGRRRVDRDR